ncbi:aminopeptidase N [Vibrio natriegens]|uniref:Aminopeptidase N n=1 Tax=Vibrio natriegens NBRC 15636 = ATCC 14048 = DSM 759 TaxID=1219067 RepID=A0AAN0Y2B8_VIBNA|nr:aminopeptidase N [Vibrio natriegens]ALR15480.1 aminopeptidase N [Vibrio natriegens NBRC 15636 = ATCC 14048 = DSM 759]ANQ12660.1 aminopeptidase N [Vibrio natriegens NBRC 15636 = ATCC 14048 = DSM 759]EPM42250.1 aminopeptidase [Vibrio natriegens NBRC 15636 = ATCC 14048 = DSM 759]MDX6027058.1 aminopeptidase N [Vibrio natriegens NBRC 15636 = ATCC 14048 = DSM 759]UUI10386.1 aminopeptidase N [Vibrio natriegens]
MSQAPQAKYRKDYQAPSHIITDIDLTFDLFDNDTIVTAVSKVIQKGELTTLELDGEGLELRSVKVNGEDWAHHEVKEASLVLSDLPAEFELEIITKIDPEANTALEGLYKSGGAFCTQCEAEGFRRITYYLDRPDVLAKYTTKVIADKGTYPYLLSNGNRIAEGDAENGRHWVQWQDPHPKPAYLFALVAGDFDVLRDNYTTMSGRNVELEIFVDKGNLDRAPHAMTSLINSMKWDEERFGLEYDLDIYMIVAVDFFNMGAMENKGLNIFNSKFVLANDQTATDRDYLGIEAVIGHEYFHNWTGNRVTCRDWFQLSLKEGLTVFRDQEFSSDLGSRAVNRIDNVRIIRGPQFAEDSSPMSHPIRPDKVIEMNNFYTLTVYEKGSEVIRMYHTLLGEEGFQKGMKLYFERHDGTAATCEDFVSAMEDATGVDLQQFRLWYSQSGTPTLRVNSEYNADAKTYALTVEQFTEATHDQAEKQALHIPFDIELYDDKGQVIPLIINGESVHNVLDIKQDKQTFVFENVDVKPVPSLLREFSAPVKLEYGYSDEELIFLMKHATNDFARWDASQMLLAKYIRQNVVNVQAGKEVKLSEELIDAFRGVLLDANLEPAFIAQVLSLPSINEITGWYQQIDIDAVDTVLNSITLSLSKELEDELSATYHTLKQADYSIEHDAIGKRALRNQCLQFLAHTENGNQLVQEQYASANNMTDTIAAMTAANNAQLECRETLMADYSDKWKHDGLVMDKWFVLQGSNPAEDALEKVKATMSHEAFSLKNPNRIRSLIGSFLSANPVHFHDKAGSGYLFAGEILRQLNDTNPQVASRLIDPLLKFRKYDESRQALIRAELEKLKAMDNLAKDLFEKVTKALDE